ncbi:MAG: hypothetical protein K9W44_11010 [Candidatus Lokiarchaeota archaeon]|nr:hypothetical protein [Candidatus Harpocratesius repetitus]
MITLTEIKEIANNILTLNPDPVVQYLIIRNILEYSSNSSTFQESYSNWLNSKHVKEIIGEQKQDGSWGAFHKRWPIRKKLFISSTLSLLSPDHPIISKKWKIWYQILKSSFKNGEFDEQEELKAHKIHTGLSDDIRYLHINSKYHIELLSSRNDLIEPNLQSKYIRWLWNQKSGIMYLSIPLQLDWNKFSWTQYDRGLRSLEIVSRMKKGTRIDEIDQLIQLLWNKKDELGFWDFGPKNSKSIWFPLSDNWRKLKNRKIDWTTRLLHLFKQRISY